MAYYFSYDTPDIYLEFKKNLNDLEQLYSPEKLHCTMLYVNGEYKNEYSKIYFPPTIAKITDIEVWGNKADGFYLVALLKSQELKSINQELRTMFNVEDKRGFTAHISLQKNHNENSLLPKEDFNFLIDTHVRLTNFYCHPPKNKTLTHQAR